MLDKLKPFLEGNDEALNILKEVEGNITQLTGKLNTLEVDSKKAFDARDSLKAQIRLAKEKLGLEDLTEESLTKVLKGKSDDTELNNLKTLLANANKEKDEIKSTYESKLSTFAMKQELSKTGLAQKAINADVYGILENIALAGATYKEDGSIVYTNDDGSTKYVNGKPMTLADRVSELQMSDAYKPLFKADGVGGSGANPQSSGGNPSMKRSEMTPEQKGEFINKHGQEAYLNLAK